MKTTIYSIALLSATLFVTSCGNNETAETKISKSHSIKVNVSNPQTNGSGNYITASGKIAAANSASISTRMMGFVNNIKVNVGDNVQKGQLLLIINNSDLKAKKAQAESGVSQASTAFNNIEKDYNRFRNLFTTQSVSQKQMDDMTANFDMAKARLEGAKQMKNEVNAQFAYSNISAPFSGVITSKFIEIGNMANPGMPLLAIESTNKFEVTAMVPESQISQIKKGAKVQVLVKSLRETIKGTVSELSTSAKNTGGQYLVKIALKNKPANILSGMYVTVKFPSQTAITYESIFIPIKSLVTKGDLRGLYTVSQQNTAILRWLRLGRTQGDMIEVLSGLNATEKYVESCESKVYNGASITIQ